MGISLDHGEGGGRKHVDLELNLVPFIDMMSCLVAFLLITAVWTNLAQIPVRAGPPLNGGGRSDDEVEHALAILIAPDALFIGSAEGEKRRLPSIEGAPDWDGLRLALDQLGAGQHAITIAAEDGVQYQTMVATMDVSLARGFSDVMLSSPQGLAVQFRQ